MADGRRRKRADGRGRAATTALVADRAGVSRATVSRVFTSAAPVSNETRTRVLAAARAVGYEPPIAETRGQIGGGPVVGLLMGALRNPFYQEVMTGFLSQLRQRDLRAMCQTVESHESAEQGLRAMLRQGVDAVIAAALSVDSAAIAECARQDVPVVLINRVAPEAGAASVQTDNVLGGRAAAEFLHLGGHRRCAFIGGLETTSTNRDRLAGFRARLTELGHPEPIVEGGEYSYEFGRESLKRLMLSAKRPDAIFCANDLLAFGALDALRHDLSLRAPADVSVIGFDDVPMAAWPCFDLTTIRQRRRMMIDAALDRLDCALRGAAHPEPHVAIEGRLIVRGSARFARE